MKKGLELYNDGDGDLVVDSSKILEISIEKYGKEWVIDSSHSYRICPFKDQFINFKETDDGHVLLGDNFECKVRGTGSVKLKLYNG